MTDLVWAELANAGSRARWRLAGFVFLQMLPATMLSPVVRPLFAAHHGGDEGAMHAFLSLGMLGALVGAPLAGRWMDRQPANAGRALGVITALDAMLFLALGLGLPTSLVLVLRTLEGGVHVAASTLLLAGAARLRTEAADPRALPLCGAAILTAVAAGSVVGGALVRVSVLMPFVVGALLLVLVAVLASGTLELGTRRDASAHHGGASVPWRRLALPLGAAFAERFGIGCMVVSFSLFARSRHNLDDATIGGLYAVLTVSFALAMYPAGRLAERGGTRASFLLGGLSYAASLALLAFAPTFALAPCMLLAGLASAPLYASSMTSVVRIAPTEARARAVAAFHAAGCAGMLVGPAVAGIVSALVRLHYEPAMRHQAALLAGAAGVLVWWLVSAPALVRAEAEVA